MKKDQHIRLENWFSSRFFLVVFSLVLSFILWFYVVGNRNEGIAKTYEVRLDFLNPPANLALFPSVKTVAVTLNGERRAMNVLQNSQLTSEVDLKNLSAGRHTVPVHFKAPSRINVAQIVPKDVEIELARMVDKKLKVKILPPENMPERYIMDGATSNPDIVVAHGREDQLSSIYEISVRPTLEELFRGGVWRIPLRSPSGIELDFSPADVAVSATYYQGVPRKEIPIEVRTRGTLPPNLRLLSAKAVPGAILVEGRTEAFNQVNKLYTKPINLGRLSKSTSIQTKIAEVPAGLSLLSSPAVTVNVELKTLNYTRDYEQIPISVTGASTDTCWSVEPAAVTVYIEGNASVLQNLTLKELKLTAFVDVSNIIAPSMRLPVYLKRKEITGVESVSVEPLTVKVTRQSK